MNIKEGQYARYNDNLYTVNYYGEDDCILLSIDKQREFSVNPNHIKTASTPMELIEVGDLVVIDDELLIVKKFDNDDFCIIGYKHLMKYRALEDITKILTPNTNGGFDLQWESEKE